VKGLAGDIGVALRPNTLGGDNQIGDVFRAILRDGPRLIIIFAVSGDGPIILIVWLA
jgi:hypothetical protein